MDAHPQQEQPKPSSKAPVVRGARACTVCRAAKMKCVGAEDGQKQCQRCKRAGVDCIFEKHRRGRKPGSKLSEASKMLRRLEKGLSNAKLKSQSAESTLPLPYTLSGPSGSPQDGRFPPIIRPADQHGSQFTSNELPPLNLQSYHPGDGYNSSNREPRSIDPEDEEEDTERSVEVMIPAKMINKENRRQSYFRTVLGPEHETSPVSPPHSAGPSTYHPPPPRNIVVSSGPSDPLTAGIVNEDDVKVLFDLLFLRLNPFINLFDPSLHTVNYVRSRCPFLLSTLIMAGCKFFKPELYKQCRKIAQDFAIVAFAEGWKRLEVVQAFACLTYWKEPEETRTWMYIGYAARMAVELDLNRYVPLPSSNETDLQLRERRNRERTYLVLFVHDRSLSMQTGRQWMLPEDDFVRNSMNWHEFGGSNLRPEDVIVAAFVQLRRMASETTDIFFSNKASLTKNHDDVNYEVVLRNCNAKLTQWMDTWQHEMRRAGGEAFHFSMLSFFRLHVRLFLNTFGIQTSMAPGSRTSPSLQALSVCFTSALETLQIVAQDFASMSMLRYGQDSITVMTAYSAVFLLRILRNPTIISELHEGVSHEIHTAISKAADAYHDASVLSPASSAAAIHARFLRSLIANDFLKVQSSEKDRLELMHVDSRFKRGSGHQSNSHSMSSQSQSSSGFSSSMGQEHGHPFLFPTSPSAPVHPSSSSHENEYMSDPRNPAGNLRSTNHSPYSPQNAYLPATLGPPHPLAPHHASEMDAHYWRNMLSELGYSSESGDQSIIAGPSNGSSFSNHLPNNHQTHTLQPPVGHQRPPYQGQPLSHTLPTSQPHSAHQSSYHHMHGSSYGR